MVHESKKDGENNDSLMRRFKRKTQSSGLLKQYRRKQRHARPESELQKKRKKKRSVAKKAEIDYLRKIGRLPEEDRRYRRR